MDGLRRTAAAAFLAGMMLGGEGVAAQQDSARAETAASSTASGPFSVTVDLSDRMLYVMRGDDVVREYRVAIGQPEHPTPTGSFTVRRLIWNPRWVPPDAAWARGRRAREPGDPRNPMGRVKIF